MEKSMSSPGKALSSRANKEDSLEESGWTIYFEDFFCSNNEEQSSISSGYESASLVSDAASSAAKKLTDNDRAVGFSLDKSKKLSFKKRKDKGAIVGDSLEDTASSPVNSDKVRRKLMLCVCVHDCILNSINKKKGCYINQLDINQTDMKILDSSEEKGDTSSQTARRSDELGTVGRNSEYTELKRRGLCLVPVSTLANYLC
ncbi:hypothetical protein RJ639_047260 [Escallonia herrerae]|uniref:Uncharacterized protein n=1 Tax=Escallonia herrerae TaxID=1293975 RepID=A0AA89AXW5_9ASTE|nr:hypothetical protein RJ639_047260 [Escallonia herrerae]